MKTPTTLPLLFAAILHGNSEAVGTDYEYRKTLLRSHKPDFDTNMFLTMKPAAFALSPELKSPISEDESSRSREDLLKVQEEDNVIDDGKEIEGDEDKFHPDATSSKESVVDGTKSSPFPNRRRYRSGKKKNMRAASTNTSSSASPAPSYGTTAIMAALSAALIMVLVRGDDDDDGAPEPPSKPAVAAKPSPPSESSGGGSKPDANDSKPSPNSPVGKGGKTPLSGGRAGKPIAGGKGRGKGKGSKGDDDDLAMLDDENYWKGIGGGGGSGSGGSSGAGGFGGGPVDPYGPNMFNGWGYYNINRYPTRLDRPRSMWDDSSADPLKQALKVVAVPLAIVCAVLAF